MYLTKENGWYRIIYHPFDLAMSTYLTHISSVYLNSQVITCTHLTPLDLPMHPLDPT